MSLSDASMMFKGKVFHSVIVLERSCIGMVLLMKRWYDIVKWMVGPGCSH